MKTTFVVPCMLLLLACGDDAPSDVAPSPDAAAPAIDAGVDANAPRIEAGSSDAATVDAGAVALKPACSLLSAAEVAAVLGVGQAASELVGGSQCQFSSTDATRKSVRGLLEIVGNGREIFDANVRMSSAAGRAVSPQSGVGDQAAFISESDVRSSMFATRGDVLIRINLGWGDPGVDSATQLAGERTLMTAALSRL